MIGNLEMKSKWLPWVLIFSGLIIAGMLPFTGASPYIMGLAFTAAAHAALAIGWNILGGYAGYESFGHSAFVGVGTYTAAVMFVRFDWSPLMSIPVAVVVATLLSLVLGYVCLRLRGPYFAVMTLIVSLAVAVVVRNWSFVDAGSGIFIKRPGSSPAHTWLILYTIMLAILGVTIVCARLIEKGRIGVALRAVREDEEVASTQGISTTSMKVLAFGFSAGLAGAVGAIMSWSKGYLEPNEVFSVTLSVNIVMFALLGGRRSWIGPLIGAVGLTLLREVITVTIGDTTAQIIFGLLLIVVILYLPHGLIGEWPWKTRTNKSKAAPQEHHMDQPQLATQRGSEA